MINDSDLNPLDLPDEPEGEAPGDEGVEPWRVLVVDDDQEVHLLSRLALDRFSFEGRPVRVVHAHSGAEARDVLKQIPGIALILLDVIMETDTAGLEFAQYVRQEARNALVRIVLRTGQPGQVPPREVVTNYEIDDYRTKTELTYDRLLTVVTTALRNYRQLLDSERQQQALRRAYDELNAAELRARLIFEGASDGMYIANDDMVIVDANPAAAALLGTTVSELINTPVLKHVPASEVQRLSPLLKPDGERQRSEEDFPFQRKDGSIRLGQVAASRLREGLYVHVVRDVTQQRANEALIRRLAYQDGLTGLSNRTDFLLQLEEHLRRDEASAAATVMLISLGNFREVNDTLGHAGGDELLAQVGGRLRGVAGPELLLARTGPAQFGLLLPAIEPASVQALAQAILLSLQRQFHIGRLPVELHASVAMAEFPKDGRHAGELLRKASVALHHARQSAQSVVCYKDDIDPFSVQRLALVSNLKDALTTDQLQLWYQARLNLKTDRVRAIEAVIRWQHPERGVIAQEEFVPVAQATGLSAPLQRWALQTALRQARDWAARGLRLNFALNCPLRHVTDPDFVAQLLQRVRDAGLPPNTLTLQFRREDGEDNGTAALPGLQQLAQQGLRLSLDDFVIGRSALAHVRKLPLHEVRLSREWVQGLREESGVLAVRSAIRLAHELHLEVAAEGVETESELRQLRLLGCDYAQGYHFARAMPARELETWISQPRDSAPRLNAVSVQRSF